MQVKMDAQVFQSIGPPPLVLPAGVKVCGVVASHGS